MKSLLAIAAALGGVLLMSSPALGQGKLPDNIEGKAEDLGTESERMECDYRTPNLWEANDPAQVTFVSFDQLARGEVLCQPLNSTGGSYPIEPVANQQEYFPGSLARYSDEFNRSIALNPPPPLVIGRTDLENQKWGTAETFLKPREDEFARNVRSNLLQLILLRMRV
jgi:hypothetical protein